MKSHQNCYIDITVTAGDYFLIGVVDAVGVVGIVGAVGDIKEGSGAGGATEDVRDVFCIEDVMEVFLLSSATGDPDPKYKKKLNCWFKMIQFQLVQAIF